MANLHPLLVFLILRSLLSTTFPQGFRISTNIGHLTLGSGGKHMFKHMDKFTIESIGPEGRCFENGNFKSMFKIF